MDNEEKRRRAATHFCFEFHDPWRQNSRVVYKRLVVRKAQASNSSMGDELEEKMGRGDAGVL